MLAEPLVLRVPSCLRARPVPRSLKEFLTERSPTDVGCHRIEFGLRRRATFFGDGAIRFDGGAVAGETDLRPAADQICRVGEEVVGADCGGRFFRLSPWSSLSGVSRSQSFAASSRASGGGRPAFRLA